MNIYEAIKLLKNNHFIVEATSQLYCMNCGAKVGPHDNYCSECGEELEEDEDVGSKEEAEELLGKLTKYGNEQRYCSECGTEIDRSKHLDKCPKCGAEYVKQDSTAVTFKQILNKFMSFVKEFNNESDNIDNSIIVKYGIKDDYMRFIIDFSNIENYCEQIAAAAKKTSNSNDKLAKVNNDTLVALKNSFRKVTKRMLDKCNHIRYKNSKFYYECQIDKFNSGELTFITRILTE